MKTIFIIFMLILNLYSNSEYSLDNSHEYNVYYFEKKGSEAELEVRVIDHSKIDSITLTNISAEISNRTLPISAIVELEYTLIQPIKLGTVERIFKINGIIIYILKVWIYPINIEYDNLYSGNESEFNYYIKEKLYSNLEYIFLSLYKEKALVK